MSSFRLVLIEPEIPQNTGNIARLAAATKIPLLLVGRLGFKIDDKYLKRAAMDYWYKADITIIPTLDEYFSKSTSFVGISTKGNKYYNEIYPSTEDQLDILFGNESSGLPKFIYENYADRLYRIPMGQEYRSLNLSNSAAIITYHLLEKEKFKGLI